MAQPRVSILMATYNRPQYIAKAVQSMIAQTVPDWELVLVDDSEGNATLEVVETLAKTEPRIRYIHRKEKGSIAQSSNVGLGLCRAPYVAILDDDDWWIDNDKLKKQIDFLDSHPDYIGCGGGFVMMNEHEKEIGRILKPKEDDQIRRVMLFANPMANSTTMFRLLPGVRYDETVAQFADWDFWLTLGLRGKLYNFQEYFLGYRMWTGSSSFSKQKQNALSGKKIVLRHWHEYPGFSKAILIANLYVWYASLPEFVRKGINSPLSRIKKYLFSGN